MPTNGHSSDGRAVIAPWLIKTLAGSFLTLCIGWAVWATTQVFALDREGALTKQAENTHYAEIVKQLDRMEMKLDEHMNHEEVASESTRNRN